MKNIYKSLMFVWLSLLACMPLYAQWTQSTLPVSDNITDILQYGNVWYVATSNNGIQRTQNFTQWNSSSAGIGTSDIRRIISSIEGANIVLYASTANGVYRSTMLGYNWTAVNNGLTSLNVGDIFSDGTILLASTADGVFRSVNFGQNWSSVSIGAAGQSVRCFLKNGTDILAGLANPGNYLYRSTDNGLTWSPYGTGLYEVNLLAKLDGELFASSGTLMYHSTDNGLTWSPASSGLVPGMYIRDMTTLGEYLYVATDAGGYVQHTDNTDFLLITAGMPMGGTLLSAVSSSAGWVVFGTLNNGLWYATNEVLTEVPEITSMDFEVTMSPNPVSDHSILTLTLKSASKVEITITNTLGQLMFRQLRGTIEPGTHRLPILLDNFPPGNYFLTVNAGSLQKTLLLIRQ